MTGTLTMYVIYDHPIDFPNHYVARRHFVLGGGRTNVDPACLISSSLEKLRACLPDGLYCLGRYPDDDPKILEVWL
jgi:hypothetical protein